MREEAKNNGNAQVRSRQKKKSESADLPKTRGYLLFSPVDKKHRELTVYEKAEELVKDGKIVECLETCYNEYSKGPVTQKDLSKVVQQIINHYHKSPVLVRPKSDTEKYESTNNATDITSCPLCLGLLLDPITIPCGHTFCRECIFNEQPKTCKKCGMKQTFTDYTTLKVNVVIQNLLEKWFPKHSGAASSRSVGCRLLANGDIRNAVDKFSAALYLNPSDHVAAYYRSQALVKLRLYEKALQDAERVVRLRPDWPLGYYRMGCMFDVIGRYEDSFVAYMQCLIFNPTFNEAKNGMTKALQKLLYNMYMRQSDKLQRQTRSWSNMWGVLDIFSLTDYEEHEPGMMCSNSFDQPSLQRSISVQSQQPHSSMGKKLSQNYLAGTPDSSTTSLQLYKPVVKEFLKTFLSWMHSEIDKVKRIRDKHKVLERIVDSHLIDKDDFECTLCYRLLWQPVTTPCGHMFCRLCLDRSLDHSSQCPLCKSTIDDYLAERRHSVTEVIDVLIKKYLMSEHLERKQDHEEEMDQLARASNDANGEIPVFVCTISFPTIPCPLHVFEPRYRHLIRQCIESGIRQFGMCLPMRGTEGGFAEYGTMLEIRNIQYFPDGRSVVDTIGGRRFRVLRPSMRDGYHTASVEFLSDRPLDYNDMQGITDLHDRVHLAFEDWLNCLPSAMRNQMLQHYGPMPRVEEDYLRLPNGPSWCWWAVAVLPLDPRIQLTLISLTSLRQRLEALDRVIQMALRNIESPS